MKNGFSLIEVLVSILILAVGVVGTADMQLTALRAARQSAFHAFAQQLAAEIADAMRANHGLARGAAGVAPYVGLDYRSAGNGEPSSPAKLCYASACDARELAEFEIYEWKKRVKAALPGGRIAICRDANPWQADKNALAWACNGEQDGTAPVVIKLGWQAKNPDGGLKRDSAGTFPPLVALTVGL